MECFAHEGVSMAEDFGHCIEFTRHRRHGALAATHAHAWPLPSRVRVRVRVGARARAGARAQITTHRGVPSREQWLPQPSADWSVVKFKRYNSRLVHSSPPGAYVPELLLRFSPTSEGLRKENRTLRRRPMNSLQSHVSTATAVLLSESDPRRLITWCCT